MTAPRPLGLVPELRLFLATHVLALATALIPDPALKVDATLLWLKVARHGLSEAETAAALAWQAEEPEGK